MKLPSRFKHGFLNTLEHALTRVADAATSIVLLWALPTESFSKLALSQAAVAPLLFFFISPEGVIYRDFSAWKAEGPRALSARLRALRLFGWGKAQAALLLSLIVALAFPASQSPDSAESWTVRFFGLVWAFSLSLAPQVSGADREFLRLDLKLRELNLLSLYQKLSLLGGTVAVALAAPGRIELLAAVAAFSALSTALLARWRVRLALVGMGATPQDLAGLNGPSPWSTLAESLQTFSVWAHLQGVVANWIQTLDLFMLGLFRFPAREVGLYAAVLKLANFSFALPVALANFFSVLVARENSATADPAASRIRRLVQLSLGLLGINVLQALALAFLAPWAIAWLSHGRWSEAEQAQMHQWLQWILVGAVILGSTYLVSSWISLRQSIRQLFFRVYMPWGVVAFLVYGAAAKWGGLTEMAQANAPVALSHALLLMLLLWFSPGKPVRE